MFGNKGRNDLTINLTNIPTELESQFVLRLPLEPAQELRSALRSGDKNIKDRLTINLENDMRHGSVRFDNYVYSAKLKDLPTACETLKTTDRKTFYKTADVTQMLICKENDNETSEEEESPKKFDSKKAEKKFLHPHGITPPLKNVRKHRFRKIVKMKNAQIMEVENEVKRLLSTDSEAIAVHFEVDIDDDEDDVDQDILVGEGSTCLAEQDLFGEDLVSSEDDVTVDIGDYEDSSRLSFGKDEDPSRLSFGKGKEANRNYFQIPSKEIEEDVLSIDNHDFGLSEESLKMQLNDIEQKLDDIKIRRDTRELDIGTIENQALKQRFRKEINDLIEEENILKEDNERITVLLNREQEMHRNS